jgi:hypothetical protein
LYRSLSWGLLSLISGLIIRVDLLLFHYFLLFFTSTEGRQFLAGCFILFPHVSACQDKVPILFLPFVLESAPSLDLGARRQGVSPSTRLADPA